MTSEATVSDLGPAEVQSTDVRPAAVFIFPADFP